MPLPGPVLDFGAIWIGPANADNFMAGRAGYSIVGIVDHHSEGDLNGLIHRFTNPPAVSGGGASAHFAIDREEEVRDGLLGHRAYAIRYQIVDTDDMAFADANYFANLTTVAIEHIRWWGNGPGTPNYQPITDAQYASSSELHMLLALRYGFPLDLNHVEPHNHYANTTCPGDLSIPRIIQGDEPMNLSHKRALVRLAYVAGMGREPESFAALDSHAAAIKDDGSNADEVVTQILDSTEAQAHRAVSTASGVPPHTHVPGAVA